MESFRDPEARVDLKEPGSIATLPDRHSMRVLEFEDIKELIARKSLSELGRREVQNLYPLEGIEEILELQNRTAQIIQILSEGEEIPLGGLKDLSSILFAASKEAVISPPDFLDVLKCLQITAQVRKILGKWSHLPYPAEASESLTLFPALQSALSQTFDARGRILDSASPRLRDIRESMREVEDRLHSKIQKIFNNTAYHKMFQEQIITTREGRYVIPVKHEYRGVFEGLVQDASSSGATVFMEPLEIVDLNNSLREAKVDEKHEIEYILKSLSLMVGRHVLEIGRNLKVLGYLDMIRTLARFAIDSRAVLPGISESGHLILRSARHPLLGGHAIPIDVEIGRDFNLLVITGPNTGGKTVTLKTIGLFSLMGLSGMPILASEGSQIPHFRNIFADIGDEQSITQNLSTFSSHMSQIIKILNVVGDRSLVLLDELGAGTDPKEGTALGIALLEHLSSLGAKTVITTHYGELKYFASTHPDARNAAMEFDSETLQPSYKIVIGLPGRSCAIAIAGRLGLPAGLLSRAEKILTEDYVALDRLLQELKDKEHKMTRELAGLEESRIAAQKLQSRYEEALFHIETEKTEVLTQAFSEAEDLFHSARSEIKKIIKSFNRQLAELSKSPGASRQDALKLQEEATSNLDRILTRLEDFKKKKELPASLKKHDLGVGDRVFIPSLGKDGEILEIKDDELNIQVEKVKLTLPFWKVEHARKKASKAPQRISEKPLELRSPSQTLNLRGKYVDEALYELEKFIDDAVLGEARSFYVVHGKGTGALRKAIHQFLKQHSAVLDFRLGEAHEGSWGVTVVTLK